MVHRKLIKPASWDVVYILETKQDFKIRYDVGDTFAWGNLSVDLLLQSPCVNDTTRNDE